MNKRDFIDNLIKQKIICFDVETTGLSSYTDEILLLAHSKYQ